MSKHLTEIKAMLYEFGLLFNQAPASEKIDAYAKALEALSTEQIQFALKKIIRSGSVFFPSVGEIFSQLQAPKFDEAPLVATEIIKLIRTYGPHAEAEMMRAASPVAFAVLNHLGATDQIRNSENIDVVRAQLERLARSVSAKIERGEHFDQVSRLGQGVDKKTLKKLEF